jgi:hypothetical protein
MGILDVIFRDIVPRSGEKLVRERGAGSGERGAGILSPNFLEF